MIQIEPQRYEGESHVKKERLDSIFKGTYRHRIIIDTIYMYNLK